MENEKCRTVGQGLERHSGSGETVTITKCACVTKKYAEQHVVIEKGQVHYPTEYVSIFLPGILEMSNLTKP